MTVKVFFSLACANFAFCNCISTSSDVNGISENTWIKLDPPAAQNVIINLKKNNKKLWKNNKILNKNVLDEQRNNKILKKNVEYDRFVCAANIIRRCGQILHEDTTKYLKYKYIHEHYLRLDVQKENWFEYAFKVWRFKTYKPKNGTTHQSILRLCPANQITKGRANQEEFFDFIENSASERAQKLRALLPTYKRRRYVAALLPCSFYKMCTYLPQGGSLAFKKSENGAQKSLTEALLTHNHWRMNSRDIRYLNIILSMINNFELSYKTITDDGIVFPAADLKTGCDIE